MPAKRILSRITTDSADLDRVQDAIIEVVNPVLAATRLEMVTEQPATGTPGAGGFTTTVIRAATTNPVAPSVRAVVPSSSSSLGSPGQVCADLSWLYICVGTNTWRRVAISAF